MWQYGASGPLSRQPAPLTGLFYGGGPVMAQVIGSAAIVTATFDDHDHDVRN
jgi:hypothetical protein